MRHPELLDRSRSLLLVVDIQERLAAVMADRDAVVEQAGKMVLAAQCLDIPILVTEQYPKGLGRTVHELRKLLDAGDAIEKLAFSCCAEPELREAVEALPERDQVVLVGMEAHVCVFQTALDVLAMGRSAYVVADAVCSQREGDALVAMQWMARSGVFVTTAQSAIFQLLEKAGTPEFKRVLTRVGRHAAKERRHQPA